MIYFLLNEDERLIEIGMTGHMNTRLAKRRITHGNALRLLAVIEGDLLEAAAIHERFSDLKVRDKLVSDRHDDGRVHRTAGASLGRGYADRDSRVSRSLGGSRCDQQDPRRIARGARPLRVG